jgi:cytochrome c-type biogenesis protein CcmH/NrfF
MGMGAAGQAWAAKSPPSSDTAKSAMKELLCPCGCPRQNILECSCQTAAELRGHVLALLDARDENGRPRFDLSSDTGKQAAYDAILAAFVHEYGEQILGTPKSKLSWLLPAFAAAGGLGLLFFAGRRWIGRKPAAPPPSGDASAPEDDKYADKLDDELAETD